MQERPISKLPFDSELIHDSGSVEQEELAAAFALEALTSEERDHYLAHLEHCGLCRSLVGQFQTAADILPFTLGEQTISTGLKERILAEAKREVVTVEQAPLPSRDRRRGWGWPAWLSPSPAWTAAILVLAVIGLVAWNINLQLSINEVTEAPPQQDGLVNAIAEGATTTLLLGTDAAPSASARLIRVPQGSTAFLVVKNLVRLPADKEYQVWRIAGDVPVGVGMFNPIESAAQLIPLTADFSSAEAIGVSIEPKGGSPAPTGEIVLLGTQ